MHTLPRSAWTPTLLAALALCAATLPQQPAQAQPATVLSATPYPGVMSLQVDATDLERKIIRVRQTLPVRPGRMALHYPQWLPGTHSPNQNVQRLAGLQLRGNGQRIEWTRDPLDVFTFEFTVPEGVDKLEVAFDHLSAVDPEGGRVVATPEIVGLQWISLMLYPRGYGVADVTVQATMTLPEGFSFGSALDVANRSGNTVSFKPVSVGTLADSPLFSGRHFQRIDLDPEAASAGRAPIFLNVVTDTPGELAAIQPEHVAAHRALVTQADRLFGHRPYAHYDFLLSVSDQFSGIGLEHHQSSENGVSLGYFSDWAKRAPGRDLLAHEYVHSWNGKLRRPADLATPTFNTPMQDSLLWLYEGQTQFWGAVLTARAGLHSAADARDDLANTAAWLDARAGRAWRNLQDTTNEPIMSGRRSGDWRNWQRSGDYYDEARLIWTEADMLIREASNGARSMDDFARAFFAAPAGMKMPPEAPSTYVFDDIVAALNRVQAHDWRRFLRERLDGHGPGAPLAGLARGGWKLAFSEKPSDYFKLIEARRRISDFSHSIGIVVGRNDRIDAVDWGSPAFEAKVTPNATLLAVNGLAYKADRLKDAITAAKTGAPLELLIKAGEQYRSVRVNYRGGLRYPKLERIEGTPDRLSALFAPR